MIHDATEGIEQAARWIYPCFHCDAKLLTILEAWEAIDHDIGGGPSKSELLACLRYWPSGGGRSRARARARVSKCSSNDRYTRGELQEVGIFIEHKSDWVGLVEPADAEVDDVPSNRETLASTVSNAIDAAIAKEPRDDD